MAQTIKIKRSTGSSAPSTLANGELAYLNNSANKKLYIGRPGGGTGDIDVIGGIVEGAGIVGSVLKYDTFTTLGRSLETCPLPARSCACV